MSDAFWTVTLTLTYPWSLVCVQVLPLGASKGYGVAKLLEALDIHPRHALAIGDAENDVEVR